METELKFAPLLSLEEMSLRRLTASLWSESDILTSISENRFGEKEWQETFEPQIKDKILKLKLPQSFKEQMLEIVRPVGLQLKTWKDLQECHVNSEAQEISSSDSAKICWTIAGAIDYRKTAEKFVRCDTLDVVLRYKLACINCLEDDIPLLWDKLPEKEKDYFYNKVITKEVIWPYLYFCWPHILKGELSNLDYLHRNLFSFNQWAFEESAKQHNKCAVEYFFSKLTRQEREVSIIRTTDYMLEHKSFVPCKNLAASEIFRYLFLLMTPEQQIDTILSYLSDVLWRFHHYPWPHAFLENEKLFWTFVPPIRFGDLLFGMVFELKMFTPHFPKLFLEFFIHSPLDFKKYFCGELSGLEMTPARHFLSAIFKSGDSESIEAMFKHVDAEDRLGILNHPSVFRLFLDGIWNGKWRELEACLRELSGKDKKSLKKAFTRYLDGRCDWIETSPEYKRFFEFFNETDEILEKQKTGKKRKLEYTC